MRRCDDDDDDDDDVDYDEGLLNSTKIDFQGSIDSIRD